MREFFHGWRRKIGCVTLLMALLMTAVWMICLFNHAFINRHIFSVFPIRNGGFSLFTDGHSVSLARCEEFTPTSDTTPTVIDSPEAIKANENERPASQDDDQSASTANSTTATAITVHINLISIVDIPFWPIVLTLTLISAFLLFSKPRKSTQVKSAEPTSIEGA